MHNDIGGFDSRLGMVFGFVGFLWKIVTFIVLDIETSQTLLTMPNFIESTIMAAWCTAVGLAITWFVNWFKKKWLGITKKKKDGDSR